MNKTQIISALVAGFKKRLEESEDGIIYAMYGEYLIKEAELKKGVKTDEV